MIRELDLVTSEVPWFSKTQPISKPMYENERAIAYWDIPLYAGGTHVKANRIDASIVDKENNKVSVIEMSCPWVEKGRRKMPRIQRSTRFYGGSSRRAFLNIVGHSSILLWMYSEGTQEMSRRHLKS